MIKRWGNPPNEAECRVAPPPENLVVKLNQTVIPPSAPDMHTWLGKSVSVVAIARQLNRAFDFGSDGPVAVEVPGYGKFLLGPEGWCVLR